MWYFVFILSVFIRLENDPARPRQYEAKSIALLNGGLFPSTHYPQWTQHLLRIPLVASVAIRFANRWLFGNSLNQVSKAEIIKIIFVMFNKSFRSEDRYLFRIWTNQVWLFVLIHFWDGGKYVSFQNLKQCQTHGKMVIQNRPRRKEGQRNIIMQWATCILQIRLFSAIIVEIREVGALNKRRIALIYQVDVKVFRILALPGKSSKYKKATVLLAICIFSTTTFTTVVFNFIDSVRNASHRKKRFFQ